MQRKAIGIVRVSKVNGREGDSFASPTEQRERIEAACERDGLQLIDVKQELDVSGGTALENRAGLRSAIEAIESGSAQVLLAAYFDRLCRSLKVQAELVERVEQAGGEVLAVDVGQVTNGSAGQWLSGTMLGAVSEYQRRTTRERTGEALRNAVARGVPPMPSIPPGYRRGADGVLIVEPSEASIVVEAFRMRERGKSIEAIRTYMRENGIKRSQHAVYALLSSRVVLGEVHHGKLVNANAHPPIVDRALWRRVQAVKGTRGRQGKSKLLLARLGVLRCASCGGRLVAGATHHKKGTAAAFPHYRCPATGLCGARVTIGAKIAESVVVGAVRAALENVEGRASAEADALAAESALDAARSALSAAVEAFTGLEDVAATRDRLAALRENVESAQARVDQLGGVGRSITLNGAADWDRLTVDEQRDLIRATIESAIVAPGRGAERITITTA
jgi:site-specific DNA recombinase